MRFQAMSVSPSVQHLMSSPTVTAAVLGPRLIDVGGYVVVITAPGQPRMPNGLEADLELPPGTTVAIGAGMLFTGHDMITAGPVWNPRPEVRTILWAGKNAIPDPSKLAGQGEGPIPAGDLVLAGYAAGLVLFRGDMEGARRVVEGAVGRTGALSLTILAHAAQGELPESVHPLLRGEGTAMLDADPWAGRGWLAGLAMAGKPPAAPGPGGSAGAGATAAPAAPAASQAPAPAPHKAANGQVAMGAGSNGVGVAQANGVASSLYGAVSTNGAVHQSAR